jgi:hypothetical protein
MHEMYVKVMEPYLAGMFVLSQLPKVTWDPWPSKMSKCLFVRMTPLGFDLLKKERNYLKRNSFIHAYDCIAI